MEPTQRTSDAARNEPVASIVIVNYNGRKLLPACLVPVVHQAGRIGAEVVVVDNGSTDGSVDLVEREFPSVRLVREHRNLGFAGGCNVGVRAAAGATVVLLNNDAVPEPGWLEQLLKALAGPEVVVACSVVHDSNYPEPYALGTGGLSVIGHPIANAMHRPDQPFYATGASLAFKRDRCGEPFDPVFFAYYEDVLLAWEVRLLGFHVARALASHVQHLGSATAQRDPARAFWYRERNKVLTLLLCYAWPTLFRLAPLYLFDGVARLLEDLWLAARGRSSGQAGAPPLMAKYALLLKALAWLLLHRRAIARRRTAIQRARRVDDAAITALLSSKIFDDVVPSRAHTLANRLARCYCGIVRIPTVETAPEPPQHGIIAEVESPQP
jgi:GT2 family glycosyltransferase